MSCKRLRQFESVRERTFHLAAGGASDALRVHIFVREMV